MSHSYQVDSLPDIEKREGKKLKRKNECGYKCVLHMYDKFFVDYKWKEQKLTKWWIITSTRIRQS